MLYDVFAGFVVWVRLACKFYKYFKICHIFASFAIISYNLDIILDDMLEEMLEEMYDDMLEDMYEVNLINHM